MTKEHRELTTALNAIADVHCQICGRPIQGKTGVLAHHGYTRPQYGSGWQTESCFGARALPYEVSADLLPTAIERVKNWKAAVEKRVTHLQGTPEITNPRHVAWLEAKIKGRTHRKDGTEYTEPARTLTFSGKMDWSEPITAEKRAANERIHEYTQALQTYRLNAEMELQSATEELVRLETRLAAWVPITIKQQQQIADAAYIKKTGPPEPGSRSAIIAANKIKREAKEAAFIASMDLPCRHGSNPDTCKVHGHGAIFWDSPKMPNPMTMCREKREYLIKTTGNKTLW